MPAAPFWPSLNQKPAKLTPQRGSKWGPKSRLKFGWLPRSIFRAFWMNFGDMWEKKTMKTHCMGLQNQALQTFGPDRVSDQILERFGEQIGGNFGPKIEPKSIEQMSEDRMRCEMAPRRSRRAFWAPWPGPALPISTPGRGKGRDEPLPRGVVSSFLTQRGS